MDTESQYRYAGFWARVGACLFDAIIVALITVPPLIAIYGKEYFTGDELTWCEGWADFLLSWLFPAVFSVGFWVWKLATPGKMAISAKIVDARTGGKPTLSQWIIRYISYFISLLPVGLGYLWVAWDKRKQGWHDKLARTVVICSARKGPLPVSFEKDGEQGAGAYG